jgi:8-oxo-dGTP diphosphatase
LECNVPKRKIRVVSAAIADGDRYLITQRTERAVLPLMWEFPGGRVEDGEGDEAALSRELNYRLGIDAEVLTLISSAEREYEDYMVEMHLYRCKLGPTPPQPLGVKDFRWVTSAEFDGYDFTPADQNSMDALLFGDPPPRH